MSWQWRQGDRLTFLTLPEWEAEGIHIAFSTRWGGYSKAPFSSLNLGLHVGDNPEDVIRNRKTWVEELGAELSKVAIGEQVHGSKVYHVKEEDAGRGGLNHLTAIPKVDALITTSYIGLMAFFADCVPVFFYHPKIKAVAIAHAGWRGTVGKVVLNVIEELARLGGKPEDCWAAIGPSIGPCCYEVDERVASGFREKYTATSFLETSVPGHYMLNLWEANRTLLQEAGVRENNIADAKICTSCHTDSFFSHRKEGPATGRMAGWISKRG